MFARVNSNRLKFTVFIIFVCFLAAISWRNGILAERIIFETGTDPKSEPKIESPVPENLVRQDAPGGRRLFEMPRQDRTDASL